MSTNYVGIDYGSIGQSNRNVETGIHYGVISLNSLASWIYDDVESNYGKPHCPECGREIKASDDETLSDDWVKMADGTETGEDNNGLDLQEWFNGKDHCCLDCHACYWSDACFPDEPVSQDFTPNSEYKTEYSETLNCLFVTDSPYYTYARYCSPCCPGALDLDNDLTSDADFTEEVNFSGPRGYCFGHDYFEDGKAPYRVFRVADDTEVVAEVSK
jgi:hypothetical protein